MDDLDGYIRVSRVRGREGSAFISPDVQRERIEAWATHRGRKIIAWHTDLDMSGARNNRPGLQTAIRRIERGQTGGVVVAKLDRFARSLPTALEAIQRIHDAGGIVVSDAEGIDPTTPAGKMMMRLLLVIAEWELDRVRENWRVARDRAVRRGVHISPVTPTGYTRESDGRLVPHPDYAPIVKRLFELRAAGCSWSELANALSNAKVEGPYGTLHWTGGAVPKIIANRVYLGEARSGEFVNSEAHEPLVSASLWRAAQATAGVTPPRGEGALLSGILRCAGCRRAMKADKMTLRSGRRVRVYRCRGHHAAGSCQARSAVLGTVIEPAVIRAALARAGELAAKTARDSGVLKGLESRAETTAAELRAYRDDDRVIGILGIERYLEGLEFRVQADNDAQRAAEEARSREMPSDIPIFQLGEVWDNLEVQERRRVLHSLMDCVMLRRGRKLALSDRAMILWHGQGPADLPRRGIIRAPVVPFTWPNNLEAYARVTACEDVKEDALD